MELVKLIFMGDSAVSFRLVFRTIFTEPPQPQRKMNSCHHSSSAASSVLLEEQIQLLGPPPHPTQLYTEQRVGDAERVWADEWVASVILVPRFFTWLKNNMRWQNGGRSAGCQFEISLQMWSVLTRVRHNMSSAEAGCQLTGHSSPEHPSKLLILKVLMTQAQILLSRNCQAAALTFAGVPVRRSLQLKWLSVLRVSKTSLK